jgi:outer membrane receptor protein involved in Fe transport
MRNVLIVLSFIALFNVNQLYSQPGPGGGRPGGFDMSKMPAEGVISGKVIDSESGEKMKYTNVIVRSQKDSSIVTGAITDEKGEFSITKVPYGMYFVEIKYVGYKKYIVKDVKVTPKSKIVKLDVIKINQSSTQGQQIDVVADKLYVDYKIDKRVVNVSQDLSSAGMTAVQALENVPSVQVDIDGNVSLRGSSNFTVYINGKPSIIQGSDALQQIPSETIDKIEIITNPSAKYDPDGASGIINVILKKDIRQGLNGLFNASYGTWGKYSGDFLVNYFQNKFNFYVGGDYRDMNFAGGNKGKTVYTKEDTTVLPHKIYYDTLTNEGSRDHQRKSYSLKAGLGFEFTDKTSATLEGVFGMGGGGFFMNSNQRYDSTLINKTYYSKNSSGGLGTRDYWGTNGTFQHKFDDAGHQIDASFQYSDEVSENPNTSFEGKSNSDYSIIDSTHKYETRTHEGELEKELRVKADYVYPINDLQKIEAGYSLRMDRTSETYLFEELNNATNIWDTVDKYTSDMTFSNDIHSIYTTYTGGNNTLGYMVGLRGEYNYRNTQHSDTAYIYDRWDVFPSVHLSYKLNDDNQLSASYTRRVNRPHGWDLDPFITYMDAHNLRKGNAALKPEFTNSYELNYQYSFASASYVSMEGYYRHSTDIITRVQNPLPDGTIMNTFENINDDYSTGLEGMVNWRPAKWVNLSGSATFFNYRLNTILSGDTIARNTNTWSSRMNVIFNFGPNTRFQISGDYSAPSVSAQGTTTSMYGMNLAIKQDFLKNMLSVSLNVRDVFATYHRGFTTNTSRIYSENNMWREAPVVMLNLTYRLNNYKRDPKKDSNGNGGGEEPMDGF